MAALSTVLFEKPAGLERRRPRRGAGPEGWRSQLVTLHEILTTLTPIVVPFAPYVADVIHLSLTDTGSVHLERWPDIADLRTFRKDEKEIDSSLSRSN